MDSDENEYLEKTGDIQKPEKFKDPVNDSEKIDKYKNKDTCQRPKHKSDRHDEDFDHHVKRSRKEGGSYSHVRDRNSSLLNRSSSIEIERKERQKDRHGWESKNMDMDREREVSSRKERYRDRTRDRGRDREKRDRDCMYEMEKERVQESLSYNRNQSERSQDEGERERRQNKGRNHDMEHKERQRGREVRETDPESRLGGEGVVGFRDDACEKSISKLVTLGMFSIADSKI